MSLGGSLRIFTLVSVLVYGSKEAIQYHFPEFYCETVYRQIVLREDESVQQSWFEWAITHDDESIAKFLYPKNPRDRPWNKVPLARVYIRNARIIASGGASALKIADSIAEINSYLESHNLPRVGVETDIDSLLSNNPIIAPLAVPIRGTLQLARILQGSNTANFASDAFDSITIPPRKEHRATVILLHCLTGKASWMEEMARKSWTKTVLGDHVKFVALDAGESHSWFNLQSGVGAAFRIAFGFAGSEFVSRSSLERATGRLTRMIDAEAAVVPGGHANVYLAGLSQGGMLALWTGLMAGDNQIGGVAVMNTIVPLHNIGSSVRHPELPIAHFHGTSDQTLPHFLAKWRRQQAISAGAKNYSFTSVQGGHWPEDNCKQQLGQWLIEKILP